MIQAPQSFVITNINEFKIKMLHWANQCSIFCLLDNQQYTPIAIGVEQPAFECLLAAGSKNNIEINFENAFEELQAFYAAQKGEWLFGHLGYDLKNAVEKLQSNNADTVGFADAHFFVPQTVVKLSNTAVEIFSDDAAAVFKAIESTPVPAAEIQSNVIINNSITKTAYINTVKKLQQHILQGDCYEINFCQDFYADEAVINPVDIYNKLLTLSPNPFAALYKVNDRYCICASPERYLKKEGSTIISQPIKGTSKRDLNDAAKDAANKIFLKQNDKERSENVMVVDLVRNDLSKVCKEGTVKVDELFGVYSFPQVHQMISTVSGELADGLNWVDAVKATFPMGSMTGAPKKKVMELIEQYEQTKRGLFSGSIGYVQPNGDFDFNVVIRSVFYNASVKHLSFSAGSAITFYSDAEKEYEECLLKVRAMMEVLSK